MYIYIHILYINICIYICYIYICILYINLYIYMLYIIYFIYIYIICIYIYYVCVIYMLYVYLYIYIHKIRFFSVILALSIWNPWNISIWVTSVLCIVHLCKPEHYTEVLMAQIRSGSMNSISSDASATQPHFIVCSGPLQRVFFFQLCATRDKMPRGILFANLKAQIALVCSSILDLEISDAGWAFFDNIYKLVSYPD